MVTTPTSTLIGPQWTSSIPGAQILDPETGRSWRVHARWPKCRFNSPEAAAARIARTSDPKVMAAIKAQAVVPSICNCEWCVTAQGATWGSDEYQAWIRAHQEARETWPAAYWERLYPCLAFVGPVKAEAEAFSA